MYNELKGCFAFEKYKALVSSHFYFFSCERLIIEMSVVNILRFFFSLLSLPFCNNIIIKRKKELQEQNVFLHKYRNKQNIRRKTCKLTFTNFTSLFQIIPSRFFFFVSLTNEMTIHTRLEIKL